MIVAYLRASFDPPTTGDLLAAVRAGEDVGADRVLLAPTLAGIARYEDRLAMVRRLVGLYIPLEADEAERKGADRLDVALRMVLADERLGEVEKVWLVTHYTAGLDADPAWATLKELEAAGRLGFYDATSNRPLEAATARRAVRDGRDTHRVLPGRIREYIDEWGLYK